MFGLGIGEIIVIVIVAIMFVGPDKLPKLARTIGGGIRSLRRHTQDLRHTIERDASIGPSVREFKDAISGIPSALRAESKPSDADEDHGAGDDGWSVPAEPKTKVPAPPKKPDGKPRNG